MHLTQIKLIHECWFWFMLIITSTNCSTIFSYTCNCSITRPFGLIIGCLSPIAIIQSFLVTVAIFNSSLYHSVWFMGIYSFFSNSSTIFSNDCHLRSLILPFGPAKSLLPFSNALFLEWNIIFLKEKTINYFFYFCYAMPNLSERFEISKGQPMQWPNEKVQTQWLRYH